MMQQLLLLLLAAPFTAASRSWSALTFNDCSAQDPLQLFDSPAIGSTGQVIDRATGRCLTVLDCKVPGTSSALSGNSMAELEVCGKSSCGGKDQEWAVFNEAPAPSPPEDKQLGRSGRRRRRRYRSSLSVILVNVTAHSSHLSERLAELRELGLALRSVC